MKPACWKTKNQGKIIIPDGIFLASCRKLVESEFALPWLDRHLPAEPKSQVAVVKALKNAGVEYEVSPPPVTRLLEEIKGKATVFLPAPKKAPTREKLTCQNANQGQGLRRERKLFVAFVVLKWPVINWSDYCPKKSFTLSIQDLARGL